MKVLEIVLPVLVMILLGMACRKWKLLNQNGIDNMKVLVTQIMLPVAIFHALATSDYNKETGILVGIMFVMLVISFSLGFAMRPLMPEQRYRKYLPFMVSVYEGGSMAYPLYTSLCGAENLSQIAVLDIAGLLFGFSVYMGMLGQVENGEKIDTKLKFVPGSTIHFGRIVGINQLSREIVAGKVSVEEAYARLHEIVSIPYTHPIRLDLACAVGSACFSYLFGGTVFDAAAAFICGFVLQVFLNAIDSRTASKFIINLASSAVVAVCAVLLFTVGLGDSLDKIIIGSIIRLVPGVALTTSIRDFLNGDYLSGTIRIIDAFLVGGCIAIGVGAVVMTYISLTGGAPLL